MRKFRLVFLSSKVILIYEKRNRKIIFYHYLTSDETRYIFHWRWLCAHQMNVQEIMSSIWKIKKIISIKNYFKFCKEQMSSFWENLLSYWVNMKYNFFLQQLPALYTDLQKIWIEWFICIKKGRIEKTQFLHWYHLSTNLIQYEKKIVNF